MPKHKLGLFFSTPVQDRVAKPFLKWAGGKGQLWPQLRQSLPSSFFVYHEPFLGGGALFFALSPPEAILTDTNDELINTYAVVKESLSQLLRELRSHQRRNTPAHFYKVREADLSSLTPVQRAARFIYLNKTCFNGLYRVNAKGLFNVPYGSYRNPAICDEKALTAASASLATAKVFTADFSSVIDRASKQDFVYCDPPYDPVSETSSFTGYQALGFGPTQQEELAHTFWRLAEKGCYVLVSNSPTRLIKRLYKRATIREVYAGRAINSNGNKRGKVTELLISNY